MSLALASGARQQFPGGKANALELQLQSAATVPTNTIVSNKINERLIFNYGTRGFGGSAVVYFLGDSCCVLSRYVRIKPASRRQAMLRLL